MREQFLRANGDFLHQAFAQRRFATARWAVEKNSWIAVNDRSIDVALGESKDGEDGLQQLPFQQQI